MKKLLALPLLLLPLACKKTAAVAKDVSQAAENAASGDTAPAQAVQAMHDDIKKAQSAVDKANKAIGQMDKQVDQAAKESGQ
ncbi:MAG: hypothetical protein NTX64_04840 [Elusimicrobia bacterium]|nr:hypothetical protein [Elusimicrobiota bacterium]